MLNRRGYLQQTQKTLLLVMTNSTVDSARQLLVRKLEAFLMSSSVLCIIFLNLLSVELEPSEFLHPDYRWGLLNQIIASYIMYLSIASGKHRIKDSSNAFKIPTETH